MAAILAAKLSGLENKDINNILVKDITPFNLGITVIDPESAALLMFLQLLKGLDKIDPKDKNSKVNLSMNNIKLMSDVIKKGSPIPYDNIKTYHTLNDFQEEFEIEVFEGENIFVKDNNLLGKFRIKNLPKKKAQEVEFDVYFKIDTNGILTDKKK